jgi:LuxR family maltose regulon positive regulatory protein
VGATALAQVRSPQPPAIEVILTLLLDDLVAQQADVILVLDDYHVIETESVHAAITFLLNHLPPRCHVVLSSREDPPFPLSRRRTQGAVTELRAADLRFTPEETAAFLKVALDIDVPLTMETIHALNSRSEGWIAGLQLAALSLRGQSRQQAEAFIAAFAGSNRYIVDYLGEEVLARQPPEVQTFLLRTAVVERFCASLCERLLGGDGPAAAGMDAPSAGPLTPAHGQGPASPTTPTMQSILERLERTNLFLIPLDDERRWYRYHHLFADVLRSRLRQLEPQLPAALLHRASEWCEGQGLLEEAVEYALDAADFERAANLIEHGVGWIAVLQFGRFETGLGWMRKLPESLLRSRPLLSTLYAVLQMYGGQRDAIAGRLHDAEVALASRASSHASSRASAPAAGPSAGDGAIPPPSSAPADTAAELLALHGYVAVAQASVPLFSGDLAPALPLLQTGLDLVPTSEPRWRATALILAAYSCQLSGDATPAAERHAVAALEAVQESGNVAVLASASITNLAQIYLMQGRLRQAAATLEQAPGIPLPLPLEQLPGSRGYHATVGELLRERNDLEDAERRLELSVEGLAARIETLPAVVLAQRYLGLARVQQARGKYAAALATLDTFEQVARSRGFVAALVERGAAEQAHVHLGAGDLKAAVQWADASGLALNDAPTATELGYHRESAYLTFVRVRIAQTRSSLGGPGGSQLHEALRLLERLQREAAAQNRGRSVLEILVLRALALQARRDTRGAVRTLVQALEMAQPEGYVRLFADEDTPMAALLSELLDAVGRQHLAVPEAVRNYAQFLLAACRSPHSSTPVPMPRTPQESTGDSNHSAPSVPPPLDPLTERELEVLRLLAEGASNAAIAAALVVAVGTVKKHVFNVCSKLGAQNRTQAVARARALHLL